MNCGVLFSGGKDSAYAAFLAKKNNYDLSCLISIVSKNPESYMFHTPSILKVKKQSEVMNIPILLKQTLGEKEKELDDLKEAIKICIDDFNIETIVTGAVESDYQLSRIQKICNQLKIKCYNPLWKKNQIKLLEDLLKDNFEVILTGVFAYPFDENWLGRKIDRAFINDISNLNNKYNINPAGEGGEYETFVLNCPLFEKELKIIKKQISGSKNSWKMEIDIL
jgi:ABC transporter with metal-binding/Fe-S-binding domain ATP-binding protein